MKIIAYSPDLKQEWDAFVAASRNGTFLHQRDYMDYHADRFVDCSLMAYSDKDTLIAVLPANVAGDTLYSHQGLTYGGWILPEHHFNASTMIDVMIAADTWLRDEDVQRIIYKPVPSIYHRYPAEEDVYTILRLGGRVNSCMISSALPLDRPVLWGKKVPQYFRRVAEAGCRIKESADLAQFWQILTSRLEDRYGASPVHSLEEITLLRNRFPENIRLFAVYSAEGEMLAGTLVYFTDVVAHTQYIASTDEGRRINVLPALMKYIIDNHCTGLRYFDYGTSCEDAGRYLNEGLESQKSRLGGRGVCYTTYSLTL